ncbi:hypothetical protein C900_02003 [Fulvivirga imtechensis AK7]|uniref:NnrS protein involved in response to NO n=1 Tax=Fulvivirga imtechensis AK7 TaxID=1237149 RepID=L8JUU5_9BACT|nr:hypothetical protein [Fulvivirga imtechensis]ELR72008.1 hypothetical protein C900_02003 [Fulvivirga imtechensis AK7]
MQNRKLLPFILPIVMLSLLAGIWAGWIRIGWDFPLSATAGKHGALMVGSFLGTLISLERAVVLKKHWSMLVPALSGISLLFFLFNVDVWAFAFLTAGSLGQAIMMAYFLDKHKELHMSVMLSGSICWLTGNLMWLAYQSYPLAVPWWIGFLLLMITGERLELTQFLPVKKYKRQLLMVALGIFMIGIIIPFHGNGRYLAAAGLILTGLWLLKYDMATKSIKKEGQHRYSAVLLLTGYFWLISSGVLIISGDIYGFMYDAVLHTFFIGFVFSMIFAHGPVILPGVLGIVARPYHRILYFWAVLLHASLILRVGADLYSNVELRMWGGQLNGIAILAFFATMAALMIRAVKHNSYKRNGNVSTAFIDSNGLLQWNKNENLKDESK